LLAVRSLVTAPLFFSETLGRPEVGSLVTLDGDDGRHAVVVRRIRPGEEVMIGDGRGFGVRGRVEKADRASLSLEVVETLAVPAGGRSVVAVQALAKGERSELAVEMLTETGVTTVVPWAASRSIVRWTGERGERSRAKWQATAREAAKQSRRLRIPEVTEPMTTAQVARRIAGADVALILHESADRRLAEYPLPEVAEVLVVIGPEGGIAPEELNAFVAVGASPVSVSDGVLRTSTAGAVAVALLRA
jgi:16S rRNA (uracil1498-N3)-methyltransferase